MNIIAIVRTRNEALNIGRFCQRYSWVDEIIIADGGSTDSTLEIAQKYANVTIYSFNEKVWSHDGKVWGNPIDRHINFLIRKANQHQADWIIFDDCDCVPNKLLAKDGRRILSTCSTPLVMVSCIYMYRNDHYFESLSKPTGRWTPRLWAWRRDANVYAESVGDWNIEMHIPDVAATNKTPPYCLLHYFYPTEEYMERKLEFYRHELPATRNPKEYGGNILPIEEWMV